MSLEHFTADQRCNNGAIALDDVWAGVKDVPLVGTVRLGHFHLPHGLEPDMYSSSRAGIFLERYSGNAAFFRSSVIVIRCLALGSPGKMRAFGAVLSN